MTTPTASDAPLRIEGEMTIYRAEELKRALLEPLQPHTTLEVNLSAVTELDTAGVQLLMLAKRTAQKQQGQLRLVGHSAAVLEVFSVLNLASAFGDPLLPSPSTL